MSFLKWKRSSNCYSWQNKKINKIKLNGNCPPIAQTANEAISVDRRATLTAAVLQGLKDKFAIFRQITANSATKAGYTNWAEPTNNCKHGKSFHNCEALAAMWISTSHAGLRRGIRSTIPCPSNCPSLCTPSHNAVFMEPGCKCDMMEEIITDNSYQMDTCANEIPWVCSPPR